MKHGVGSTTMNEKKNVRFLLGSTP